MYDKKNTPRSRLQSIGFAINGLKLLLKQEPNVRIHLAATVTVLAFGFYKGLIPWQWAVIVFAIAIVWIAEALNTCIEMLCNAYCGDKYDLLVKIIKDISAAAVLIASITSVVIAIIVFVIS